ncbi:hypothetical protein AB0O28_31135 [Microbispora sp. NPDC088329]
MSFDLAILAMDVSASVEAAPSKFDRCEVRVVWMAEEPLADAFGHPD